MEHFANFINGTTSKRGSSFEVVSPINQKIIGEGKSLSKYEVIEVFEQSLFKKAPRLNIKDIDPLAHYIAENKAAFLEQITLETGYILQDARDIVEASVEFLAYFARHLEDTNEVSGETTFSYAHNVSRRIKLITKPYGVISAMTPQNAPLILELTVIFNALAAGNTIIVRPSSRSVGTIALLIKGLVATLPAELISHISIIACNAVDFLDISYKKSNLIHYIGSSAHGRKILNDALLHNVKALVDGEGNSTVIIDETANVEQAIKACREGMIRCNGELCSTIRTIVVSEKIYHTFCEGLVRELATVKVGIPQEKESTMGPLFHPKQANDLRNVAKKYSLLFGNLDVLSQGENYLSPILCQLASNDIGFLNEVVFGPLTGIVQYKGDEWKDWLKESPFRINDVVFSNDQEFIKEFTAISRSPRIVINSDPSIESVFEPWGGYLPSGNDEVSFWKRKYFKLAQLDTKV